MDKLKKQEIHFYLAVWGIAFLLVPLSLVMERMAGHDSFFHFETLLFMWVRMLPFLLLFLCHNFIIRLFPDRKGVYFLLLGLLLAVFSWYCLSSGRRPPEPMPGPMPERMAPPDGQRPFHPETLKIILGILLIAANWGVKAYFELLRKEERMRQLEAENLKGQLEAFRYQINPHFFMNTLNNIQSLILTEPDKAMDSIAEFSKMMRVILYDGGSTVIPLSVELEFIRKYINLMRLRYPENVSVEVDFPKTFSAEVVPPLVLASIVENAFKHGIVRHDQSFVKIGAEVEGGRIHFHSSNSIGQPSPAEGSGIGLSNARRRMELLYGRQFNMKIDARDDRFDVVLDFPATYEEHPL